MINIRHFLDYGGIRDRIVYRLVNTEKNRELLEDAPHMEFLDLSVIFGCLIRQDGAGITLLTVRNAHAKLWGVSAEELYRAAEENTPKLLPYEIKTMAEVMSGLIKQENPEEYNYDVRMKDYLDQTQVYLLSNHKRTEGAACMLYPNLLSDFSDKTGGSFYIIPSSCHELLIFPAGNTDRGMKLRDIIREVNDTQLLLDEILSYSLYYYDREKRKISIC